METATEITLPMRSAGGRTSGSLDNGRGITFAESFVNAASIIACFWTKLWNPKTNSRCGWTRANRRYEGMRSSEFRVQNFFQATTSAVDVLAMGFWTSVYNGALRTQLGYTVSGLERDIEQKESSFGIALYDSIATYQTNHGGSFPSTAVFMKPAYEEFHGHISGIQDKIFAQNSKIHRGMDADPSFTDAASEVVAKLQISSLERLIQKEKETFGRVVSSSVVANIDPERTGISIREVRAQLGLLRMLEKHREELVPMYEERDAKRREMHAMEGPVDEEEEPSKVPEVQASKRAAGEKTSTTPSPSNEGSSSPSWSKPKRHASRPRAEDTVRKASRKETIQNEPGKQSSKSGLKKAQHSATKRTSPGTDGSKRAGVRDSRKAGSKENGNVLLGTSKRLEEQKTKLRASKQLAAKKPATPIEIQTVSQPKTSSIKTQRILPVKADPQQHAKSAKTHAMTLKAQPDNQRKERETGTVQDHLSNKPKESSKAATKTVPRTYSSIKSKPSTSKSAPTPPQVKTVNQLKTTAHRVHNTAAVIAPSPGSHYSSPRLITTSASKGTVTPTNSAQHGVTHSRTYRPRPDITEPIALQQRVSNHAIKPHAVPLTKARAVVLTPAQARQLGVSTSVVPVSRVQKSVRFEEEPASAGRKGVAIVRLDL